MSGPVSPEAIRHRKSDGDGSGHSPKRRHNAIEQRRREKINLRIRELQLMLPAVYHSGVEKASKAQILADALVYVQDVQTRLRMLGVRDLVVDHMNNVGIPPRHATIQPMMGPAAAAAAVAAAGIGTPMPLDMHHLHMQMSQTPHHPSDASDHQPNSDMVSRSHPMSQGIASTMFSPHHVPPNLLQKASFHDHDESSHADLISQDMPEIDRSFSMVDGQAQPNKRPRTSAETGAQELGGSAEVGQFSSEILRLLLSATNNKDAPQRHNQDISDPFAADPDDGVGDANGFEVNVSHSLLESDITSVPTSVPKPAS